MILEILRICRNSQRLRHPGGAVLVLAVRERLHADAGWQQLRSASEADLKGQVVVGFWPNRLCEVLFGYGIQVERLLFDGADLLIDLGDERCPSPLFPFPSAKRERARR